MKLFTLSAIGIAMLMFICVLFGMQQANNGIQKMKGYESEDFQQVLSINQEKEEAEATILGQNVTSHDLQKKKEQLEEINGFNLFSSIGKGMADTISQLAEKGVDLFSDAIEKKETGE